MKKIGILIPFCNNEWVGGVNYFCNLVEQCKVHIPKRVEFTLVTNSASKSIINQGFYDGVNVLTTSLVKKKSILWWIRTLIYYGTGRDILLGWYLRSHNIEVLNHSKCRNYGTKIKAIGWIPDCQHKYLPCFFSVSELKNRDREYQYTLDNCEKVIVSSQAAFEDVLKFYNVSESKLAILRFFKKPIIAEVNIKMSDLLNKYQLPNNYFYLPNQFWVHKNHKIVIEALNNLNLEGTKVTVVCSGVTQDSRNPSYFSYLINLIEQYGLRESFKVIGLVPLADVNALIKFSVAMINPSLFEGWSTSVEEARANGKRIILSDIKVHREQSPPGALFFNPDSSLELVERIKQTILEYKKAHETLREHQATENARILSKEFSYQYLKIVESLEEGKLPQKKKGFHWV
jgi:glycosyltransferase involved in cell wall biosynthesis